MADGRKNNGGARKGAGRKPKADEQKLVEALTPYHDDAVKALVGAVKQGESWAVKEFFDRFYGKPNQASQVDVTSLGDKISSVNVAIVDHDGDDQSDEAVQVDSDK